MPLKQASRFTHGAGRFLQTRSSPISSGQIVEGELRARMSFLIVESHNRSIDLPFFPNSKLGGFAVVRILS
jgi:hypothetical protein